MTGIEPTEALPVDRMVAELLDTGLLSDGDKADLETYLEDWRAGRLDPDDQRYLTAFHARLVHGGTAEPVAAEALGPADDWQARAEMAEAELVRLRALLAKHGIAEAEESEAPPLARVEQKPLTSTASGQDSVAWKLSYQLYSNRNFPPLEPHLPELKAMGYDAIEPWLPAYEADPKAFRRALDDAGLACYGFHMPLKGLVEAPERFIDIALTLGATFMIAPYVPPEDRGSTPEFWRGLGEKLARGAERAAPHGLTVAWHNHDFEFRPLSDGSFPMDHILSAAGPQVAFEIDLAWVVRAGGEPVAALDRYADSIRIVQIKDTAPLGTVADGGWTATGDGILDWATIMPKLQRLGVDHLVAEHDNPSDWRSFARRTADYVRSVG